MQECSMILAQVGPYQWMASAVEIRCSAIGNSPEEAIKKFSGGFSGVARRASPRCFQAVSILSETFGSR